MPGRAAGQPPERPSRPLPSILQGGNLVAPDGNNVTAAVTTVKDCCTACQDLAACGAYTYVPSAQTCYFKASTAARGMEACFGQRFSRASSLMLPRICCVCCVCRAQRDGAKWPPLASCRGLCTTQALGRPAATMPAQAPQPLQPAGATGSSSEPCPAALLPPGSRPDVPRTKAPGPRPRPSG